MGRGSGRRRTRSGDKIALRSAAGGSSSVFAAGAIGRGKGVGAGSQGAGKEAELSAREIQLLNQARGPGLLVTPGLPQADRWAIQALSARGLIKLNHRTGAGSIYKATNKQVK